MECEYCLENIEGGTFIEEPNKRIYFCSLDCLDAHGKEKETENNEKPTKVSETLPTL